MDFCEVKDGVLKKYYRCDKDYVIPSGIEAIGDGAFNNYRGIKYVRTVTIPKGVKRIDRYAFSICRELKSVSFPEGLETIGESAFNKCEDLSDLTFQPGLKEIGDSAFHDCCSAKSLTLPETLTSIGNSAFSCCRQLPSVKLPESLKTIGSYAFSECWNLTELTIPAGVEHIGINPVSRCWKLTKLTVSEQNRFYKSIDNVIYSKDGRTLCASGWKTGSFCIPEGVTEIRSGAFCKCENLTEVWIPEGVTRIGEYAFRGCDELTEVHLPRSLREIGSSAFEGCSSLKSVIIPDGVTCIGKYAFSDCKNLESISLPKGITELADSMFSRCRCLKECALPESLKTVGSMAFFACESLKEAVFPASLTKIDDWAYCRCKALTGITIPDTVTEIGFNAFGDCENLSDVTIPAGVEKVGPSAFRDCPALVRVTVPDSAVIFSAFEGCSNIKEYSLPPETKYRKAVDGVIFSKDGTQLVAYPPAKECERYDIPPSVTTVRKKAFYGARIKLLVVPDSVEGFGENAVSTEREKAPYIAYSNRAFTEYFTRPVYLGPPEDVPRAKKSGALEGFVYALKIGLPEIEPWKECWFAYLRQESKAVEKMAWNNEDLIRLLMELRILSPETARNMARKYEYSVNRDLRSALNRYINEEEHNSETP